MKYTQRFAVAALVCAAWLTGCNVMDNPALMQAGGSALRAVALTDAEVVRLSTQSCAAMDAQNQVASSGSAYARRLAQVVAPLPRTINGQTVNFKVYQTREVNAWAMDNGCVRVYTGLMDLMNDDELRGVIAHEMGHVALGHSRASMRTAYAASAAREAAAVSGSAALAALSGSLAGDLAERFVNAQFSQAQETAADNYAFDLLTQLGLERKGLVTGFQKLASQGGGAGLTLLSSHPPSEQRARNMQTRLDRGQ